MEISKIIPELITKKHNVKLINNMNEYKKGNLLLMLGNDKTDLIKLVNGNLFNLSNYTSAYTPKFMNIAITERSTKRFVVDQKSYYENLKEHTNITNFKKNIEQYNGLNLAYDYMKYVNITNSHTRIMTNKKLLTTLMDRMNVDVFTNDYIKQNYRNVHIMVPIDNDPVIRNTILSNVVNIKSSKGDIKIFGQRINGDGKIYNMGLILAMLFLDNGVIKKIDTNGFNVNIIFYSQKNNRFITIHNNISNGKKVLSSLMAMLKLADSRSNDLTDEEQKIIDDIIVDKDALKNLATMHKNSKDIKEKIDNSISKFFKDGFAMSGQVSDEITSLQIMKDNIEKDGELSDYEIQQKLNNDDTIKKHLRNIMSTRTLGNMTDVEINILNKSRDKFLNKKFNINSEELTVDEMIEKYEEIKIDDDDLSHLNLVNDDLIKPTLLNFDKSYNKKLLDLDLFRIFASVDRNTEHPLILIDLVKTDTSDELNHKYQYIAKYKDKRNKTINIKVDIPIILENIFLMLNGTKKSIAKQIFSLPVTKTSEHETYLSTNYKKMRFTKVGKNLNPTITRFTKAVKTENLETLAKHGVSVTLGNNLDSNKKRLSNIEYSIFSSKFMDVKIKNTEIHFNMKTLDDKLGKLKYGVPALGDSTTMFPIGFNKKTKTVYFIDVKDNNVYYSKDGEMDKSPMGELSEFIIDMINTQTPSEYDFIKEVSKQTVGKVFTYSIITVMGRKIPTIAVTSSQSSFISVLDKMDISYDLSEKRKTLSVEDKLKYRMIQFKDFYFYYEASPSNELLLNGLYPINTKEYNFADLGSSNDMFDDYYENVFKLRHLGKSIKIMMNLLIDPITDDILKDHKMPTDIVDLILYANITLTSLDFTEKSVMGNYRVKPSAEILASHLYAVLMDAYSKYISSNTRVPFSIKPDAVIKSLLSDKLIETYSVLNPFRELQAQSKATWRGKGGINQDRAYQMNIRKYNKTMNGLIGMYSPNNGNVGIIRTLTHDPKLLNARGYINRDKVEFGGGNLLSPTELLHSFASSHADPARQNMIVMQSEALMPTKNSSKPLIGSGMSIVLPYISGSDFSFVAKDDGVVKDVDDKNGLVLITYGSGFDDIIDISDKIDKNSSSGFFISNKLSHYLKIGDKFKKNDILAKNEGYYKDSMLNGPQFAMGTMGKIAMISHDTAVEDASVITRNFADKLSSDVIMEIDIEVDTNTNILSMVKLGDHVDVSDPIVTFETVFDDGDIINMLDKLDDDISDKLSDYSFDVKKSKYSGTIVDVKMFYTRDIEDFTPSVQKIINRYINRVKKRRSKIDSGKYDSKPNITSPRTSKYDKMRITTKEVDGLLIKLYISHEDHIKIGDKVAFQTAIKTIISEIIGYGEEPFTPYRKDENIDAFFSPLSVVSRMTMDIFNLLYGNKVLIELKRQVKEIHNK